MWSPGDVTHNRKSQIYIEFYNRCVEPNVIMFNSQAEPVTKNKYIKGL